MVRYKNGDQKKNLIVANSKKLFYEKGYTSVKISEICRLCDIPIGNYSYYFKKKDDILREIYSDYLVRSFSFVQTNTEKKMSNTLTNICAIMLYYKNIYKDENILRFHSEVIKYHSMGFLHNELTRLYWQFGYEFGNNMDERECSLMTDADIGMRRQLYMNFLENGETDVEKLVRDIYTITGKLFDCPKDIISEYIDYAVEFSRQHEDINLRLV